MDPDFNNVQIVREVWRISRIILCTAGEDPLLRHEALVPANIDIEELYVKLCLLFDGFGNFTACTDGVPRKIPEDGPDSTLLRTVPLLEGINHIVMGGRVVEMDEKGGVYS